jgi:hypothetical protein
MGKQVKENGDGLIWDCIQEFSYRDQGKPQETSQVSLSPELDLTWNLLKMINDMHSIATISGFFTPNWIKVHL